MGQADLAASIGVSASYLSHIEAGRRPASRELLEQMAQTLSITVEQLLESGAPDVLDEVALKLSFAELSLRNGDAVVAQSEFALARESARAQGSRDLTQRADWGLARAWESLGDLERAIEGFEDLSAAETLAPEISRGRLATVLTRAYAECGDLGRAIDIGERALALSMDSGHDVSEAVELACTLAGCYVDRGDLTRAQILIGRAVERADRDGSLRSRAAASWEAAVVALAKHDFGTARVQTDRALAHYAELENARAVALLRVVSASVRMRNESPDVRLATAELDQAVAELTEVGTPVDLGYAETELARASLADGDVARAAGHAQRALSHLEGGDRLQRGRALLMLGYAQIAGGDTVAALSSYEAAAGLLDAAGASRQGARAWRELGELYLRAGRVDDGIAALRRASDLAGSTYLPVGDAADAAVRDAVGDGGRAG